jgi:hypothetical protein
MVILPAEYAVFRSIFAESCQNLGWMQMRVDAIIHRKHGVKEYGTPIIKFMLMTVW